MAGLSELNSFIGKFLNLWQSGRDASLHLKTCDGKATINLQLGLGQAPPPPSSQPPPRHVPGPSRQRRTQRRALAREQAEQAQAKNNVEEVAENANEEVAKNESESAEIATEVVETDGTTADKAAEASEEARKDFHCLICDFVSSWETALQIHMSKKHSTVEQVDGNATLTGEDLVEDEKYSDTCHYWKTGKIGTSFQTFLDVNEIIDGSNLSEVIKDVEKAKVLEARKCAFGENYEYVPPWKQ